MFKFGSTVVIHFEVEDKVDFKIKEGEKVKYG